jgi:hypothetical protein
MLVVSLDLALVVVRVILLVLLADWGDRMNRLQVG